MAEAKRRAEAHRKHKISVLEKYRGHKCIYCTKDADTEEHMPPRIMFTRKDRPKGLEFPACSECNNGTGNSDQVAAMIGRVHFDDPTEYDTSEMKQLLRAVRNNVPGLLEEMDIPDREQRRLSRWLPKPERAGGYLNLNGPIASSHLTVFAAKLGFALFYEHHGHPVPETGILRPMYFSNVQAMKGELPHAMLDLLPEQTTLRQGRKEVFNQFTYSTAAFEDTATLVYATFRAAFAAGAIIYHDAGVLAGRDIDPGIPFLGRRLGADGRSDILSFRWQAGWGRSPPHALSGAAAD